MLLFAACKHLSRGQWMTPRKKGTCDVTSPEIRHVFADTRQPRARSPDI